jgi:hypothetical protein
MSGFYMLAGTLTSDQSLEQISAQLKALGLVSGIEDDELELDSPANLVIRTGFDHEYILVGDATESELLLGECERFSGLLKQMQMSHEMEIYDTRNELIQQIEYHIE